MMFSDPLNVYTYLSNVAWMDGTIFLSQIQILLVCHALFHLF
jgi:hypothetical protein